MVARIQLLSSLILTLLFFAGSGAAQDVSSSCEAAIDRAAGNYSRCLLGAQSRNARRPGASRLEGAAQRCADRFDSATDRALARAEQRQETCTPFLSEIADRTATYAEGVATEASGQAAASSYNCFVGGFCSQAAIIFPPATYGYTNVYAGDTPGAGAALAAGCNVAPRPAWDAGVDSLTASFEATVFGPLHLLPYQLSMCQYAGYAQGAEDACDGEQDFVSVQEMYDKLYSDWTTPSFTGPSDSGVLAHVGLFGDPSSEGKTWDPRPCAAGYLAWESGVGQVPAACGPMTNQHYNIYSIVPSSMSAQKTSVPGESARGKLYVPDSGSVGCNDPSIPCPALTSAGIIMDPTSTSWLCAYPGDVGSNTWNVLCPKHNGITPEPFNPTVITNQCGTCGPTSDSHPFSDACRDSKVVPTGCDFTGVASIPGLMHTGPSSDYYPYNEFDVAAANVDGLAVKAIFYVGNASLDGEADAQEALEHYKNDKGYEIPLIKWHSDENNATWTCMNCQ